MPSRRLVPFARSRCCRVALVALAVLAAGALPACSGAPAADPEAFRALGIDNSFTPPLAGVFCSGQPTPAQFAGLPATGIRHVLSLRASDEDGTGFEEAQAAPAGIEFVRWPINGRTDMTARNGRRLAELLDELSAGGARPVLVTCSSSNRVGGLFALEARFVDGKGEAEALALGRACGMTRSEPAVKAAFAAGR